MVPRSHWLRRVGVALWLGGLASCAGSPFVHEPLEPAFQRGIALGFVDASGDGGGAYTAALHETRGLGATDVSLLVPLYTESVDGRTVRRGGLNDGEGHGAPNDEGLRRAIAAARSQGLAVMVFPIVRLRVRQPGEWRGVLRPSDRAAWFEAYARQIESIAAICEEAGAARLAIGSELVSFEGDAQPDDVERWRDLAARVRKRFHGRIVYSANWDRWERIRFWDAVDEIGISAYFTLGARGADPDVPAIEGAWAPIVERLRGFSTRTGRPIVFTEIGFPSVSGAAFWPWNDHQQKLECAEGEGCEGATSVEAQRRLWVAFVRVFSRRRATSFLTGAYVWLWSGAGGLRDRGYTPRGKPAEAVVKLWYAREPEPRAPR